MTNVGFYFDQTRCSGCDACERGLQGLARRPGRTGKLDAGPAHRKRSISRRLHILHDRTLLAVHRSRLHAGLPRERHRQTSRGRHRRRGQPGLPGKRSLRRKMPQGLPLRRPAVRPPKRRQNAQMQLLPGQMDPRETAGLRRSLPHPGPGRGTAGRPHKKIRPNPTSRRLHLFQTNQTRRRLQTETKKNLKINGGNFLQKVSPKPLSKTFNLHSVIPAKAGIH